MNEYRFVFVKKTLLLIQSLLQLLSMRILQLKKKEVRRKNVANVDDNTHARLICTPHRIKPEKTVKSFHMTLQNVTDEIIRPNINIPFRTVFELVQRYDTYRSTITSELENASHSNGDATNHSENKI